MFVLFGLFYRSLLGRFFYVFFIKSKKSSKKTAIFCILAKKNKNIL